MSDGYLHCSGCADLRAQIEIANKRVKLAEESKDCAWENNGILERARQKQMATEAAHTTRIADLERQLSTEHTCHDQCDRPLCVANRRVRELEAERDEAYEYLAGILSIDPDSPDCADNHGELYQSQGLADWGARQLAAFREALGEKK